MKLPVLSTTTLFVLAACGGSKPAPEAPRRMAPLPAVRPAVKPPRPRPEPPPPPPPPMEWHAAAQLAPVKGVRMPPVDVTLWQVEGEPLQIRSSAPIAKLKAGSYRLVVHEGEACGAKAKLAGAVMVDLSAEAPLVATRKEAPSVELETRAATLDGDGSILGHALVLHGEKRGKLGAPLACGVVMGEAGGVP